MIHFVVVAGDPGSVSRLAPRLSSAITDTRVFDGHHLEHTGTSGTWAVAAVTAPDPVCATRLVAHGDAMCVVNGPAVVVGDEQRPLLDAVFEAFTAGGTSAVDEILGGSYNFVGVSPAKGLHAMADFSGLFPLYYAQRDGYVAFSNRATSVAHVAGLSGWDKRALGWLIGHSNLYGEQMPARGVSYLTPGSEGRIGWGGQVVEIGRSPAWVWPSPSTDRERDNLSLAEWDDVTDGLVARVRALRNVSGSLSFALTGGKDSRLLLALARAAGLRGTIDTFTRGAADSPEVEVARAVARAAGFDHRNVEPVLPSPTTDGSTPAIDPEAIWRRLRQHSYRYESTVCPWDGMNDRLRGTTLRIQGFGGEIYKRGSAKKFRTNDPTTPAAMAELFENYQQRHDPLGVLRPAEAAHQKEYLHEWVHRSAEEVRLDLLPEKFYVDYRLGHWNGPMGQQKAGFISMNPLLSSAAVKAAMQLSPAARGGDRFHFEVMRRAAPELVTVPFLNDTWADLVIESSPVELPSDPYPTSTTPTQRALTSWQFPFLEHEAERIQHLFRQTDRYSDMGEICDMAKLEQVSAWKPGTSALRGRGILSCVAVANALLGHGERVADEVLFERSAVAR